MEQDQEDLAAQLANVRLSCQDLDKTTYLHGAAATNQRNLQALMSFEAIKRGDCDTHVAVFVTGNNVAMAQIKATEMMDNDPSLRERFGDLTKHPGIYSNGALVKGLGGARLEAYCRPLPEAFVGAIVGAISENPQRPCAALPDDCGFVFYSETEMIMLDDEAVRSRLAMCGAALSRVKGFCEDMMHMPVVLKSPQAIRDLAKRNAIYQVTVLYEWIGQAGDALKAEYVATHGEATEARTRQLAALMGEDGEQRLDFKALPAPWPSIDINAKGVNKRNAIVALCDHLSASASEQYTLDHVAVFGDAGNDLPMFDPVDRTAPVHGFEGQQAAVRVAMPGVRCTEPKLAEAANLRADVFEVLERIVRLQSRI